MKRKLTIKQRKFADLYIKLGKGTEAAIEAGYSKKTARIIASENLTKPNIKEYIEKRLKQIEEESIADIKEVLKYLTSVLRGEEKEEVIVIEGKGPGESKARIIEKSLSGKERIKAGELLGKSYGAWKEKIEHDHKGTVTIVDDIK